MSRQIVFLVAGLWATISGVAGARTWSDSTGVWRVEADLVGFNATTVIVKRADQKLLAIPIAKLSPADEMYLQSKEATDQSSKTAESLQTWTMKSGFKVVGKVVNYARQDLTFQRRRGKIYVNDRLFDNLPEILQRMSLKIVEHFEKIKLDDKQALETWILQFRGEPRVYTCEGVLFELENGDEYDIPFFFFSDEDLQVLKPGWERWLAAEKDRDQRERESFLVQSQAQAYQQDRKTNQQIAMMQLQMQAYQAGLFDLWEVWLFPGPGVVGAPLYVVVPARDSLSATFEAVSQNPGYVAGPVSKVLRIY